MDLMLPDISRICRIEESENIGGSVIIFICKVGSGRPDERI